MRAESKKGVSMRHSRRWMSVLVVLMLVFVSVAVLACNKKPSGQDEVPPPQASIRLDKTAITLDAGESEQITATLENSQEEIVWSTLDPTVATVSDDGLVHAEAKGETTVTATAGAISASCTVTVNDLSAPVISVDYKELNIVRGKSFTVTATTTWNGNPEEAEYDWQSADESIVTVSEQEGAQATLSALSVGDTTVTVSTTVREVFVSTQITVNVLPVDVAFDITNIEKVQGRYELVLTADSSLTPALTVTESGDVQPEAVVTWSVEEGSDFVSVNPSTGEIEAVATGSAVVKGTYTTTTQEQAFVRIYVTVKGHEVNLQKQILNLDLDGEGNTTASVSVDLKQSGLTVENLVRITLDGTELDISDATLEGTVLTIPADAFDKKCGDGKELVVYFTKYEFRAPACLVSKIITNEAQFLAVKDVSVALGGGGYFLLGDNITVSTTVATGHWITGTSNYEFDNDYRIGVTSPFTGTIDGNGFSVTGLTVSAYAAGWIQNMGSGSVLKNIAFKNFSVSDVAALVYGGNTQNARFENVYVGVGSFNIGTSRHTSVFGGDYINGSTFKNVVVDFSAAARAQMDAKDPAADVANGTDYGRYYKAFGMPNNCTMENVAVLGVSSVWRNFIVRHTDACDNGADDDIFVTYADGTNNNGPMPNGWSETLLAFLPDLSFAFDAEVNTSKGATYTPSNLSRYWIYALTAEAAAQGFTYENGVITVPNSVTVGDSYDVLVATPLFGGTPVTLTLSVSGSTQHELDAQTFKLQLSVSGGALDSSANLTVALSGVDGSVGELQSITVDGNPVTVGEHTLSNPNLTVPAKIFAPYYGEHTVVITTKNGSMLHVFTFDALFISLEATSADQFLSFAAVAKLLPSGASVGGYFTLGSTITLDASTNVGANTAYRIGYDPSAQNSRAPFVGTIDGQGHTVGNMKVASGASGWIELMGSGSVLTNITFDSFVYGENSTLTYGDNGRVTANGARIENVYVKVGSGATWWEYAAVFGADTLNHATLKNVVVDYSNADMGNRTIYNNTRLLGKFATNCTFENVAVLGVATRYADRIMITPGREEGEIWNGKDYVYAGYTDGSNNGAEVPTGWSDTLLRFLPTERSFDFAASKVDISAGIENQYTVENLSHYWSYALSSEAIAQGVTFTGGKVIVPQTAAAGDYVLTATSIFDGTKKTLTLHSVASEIVNMSGTQKINLGLTISGDSLQTASGNAEITLEGSNLGTLQSVTIGGNDFTTSATLSGNTLSIPYSAFGSAYGLKNAVVMTKGDKNYTVNLKVLLVTMEATTKAEFLSFAAYSRLLNYGGYFTVGANINLESTNMFSATAAEDYRLGIKVPGSTQAGDRVPFVGTIDGQGYTVSNMVIGGNNYGWIQIMGSGSTLKNIQLDNFVAGANCALTYGDGSAEGATFENVHVKVGQNTSHAWWEHVGIFGSSDPVKNATLKNVVVDFAGANLPGRNATYANAKLLGTFDAASTFNNVVVLSVLKSADKSFADRVVRILGDTTDICNGAEHGVYASNTDGTTNGVEFPSSGWDSTYWDVSGATVTWKTK